MTIGYEITRCVLNNRGVYTYVCMYVCMDQAQVFGFRAKFHFKMVAHVSYWL